METMKRFYLRWRFDYSDHKPSVIGRWNDTREGIAAFVDKTNLRRAAVEIMDHSGTSGERCVAECDGWDFINFEWSAIRNNRTLLFETVGLCLKTRDLVAEVSVFGGVKTRPRDPNEMKIHYAGFGR